MVKRSGHERSLKHARLACSIPVQHQYTWANSGCRSRQSIFMVEVATSDLVDYNGYLWEETHVIGIKYPYIF